MAAFHSIIYGRFWVITEIIASLKQLCQLACRVGQRFLSFACPRVPAYR
jgi:hypothetical protein